MRILPMACRGLALAAVVAVAGLGAFAAPQLDVAFGFDSQVLRNCYAPIRVEVGGLVSPVDGALLVRQTTGLPGDRHAEVTHILAEGTIENGIVTATIPIVEPLNPLAVELHARDGRTLAVTEKGLRLGVRQWPFPVAVGRSAGIASSAVVDAATLPLDWWAYEAAREVWIVDPPISEAGLEALGEWTVSGGSLVVMTGTNFPLLDSPTLRRLLPIKTPQLVAAADGSLRLTGTLRADATVVLARGATPLLVRMPVGAGSVSLVTASLTELSPDELRQIAERIPPAQRQPTTERVSAGLLQTTSVPRPAYFAPALVALGSIVVMLAFSLTAERRWAPAILVALLVAGCVLSGLYSNASKRWVRTYSMRTNISVISSFGINSAFCSYYAVVPRDVAVEHDIGSYPTGALVVAARGGTLASESEPASTSLHLQGRERRDVMFHSRPAVDSLRFRWTEGVAEVENRTGRVIDRAYVATEGAILALPPIEPGMNRLRLLTGPQSGEARWMYLTLRAILRPIEEWLPIELRGVWLVTIHERPQPADRDAPELAREVFITILEGEAT